MSCSPNFRYAPPQKLKINLIFRRMMFLWTRIHAVLSVNHLFGLVEKNIISLFHHDQPNVSGAFFWVSASIFLNSLDNHQTYR